MTKAVISTRTCDFCRETAAYIVMTCCAFLALSAVAAAQTETGTIRGVVTDASGASIANVRVTAEHLGGTMRREVGTGSDGAFELVYLKAGPYRLNFSRSGFRQAVIDPVTVEVNQSLRADVGMQVGEVSEQVTVEADAALLQSETSTIGGQLEEKKLVELPGRNLFTLMSLSPGVAQLNLNGFGSNALTALQPGRGSLGANFNFTGYRQTGNYYVLDGVSNTDWNINAIVHLPAVESLQELRIQSSTSTAAFGQVPGGTVNVVTRSGSRNLHGEAYNYLRNNVLDARPYNFAAGTVSASPLRYNQFGTALGGPVTLPGRVSRDPRTFFFGHYQQLVRRTQAQAVSTIPIDGARSGDLSEYGRPIYDPLSLADGMRTQFPGNRIPVSRIDPVALKWLTFMPTMNQAGTRNNYSRARPGKGDVIEGNGRLDRQISERHYLYGTYHIADDRSSIDSPFGDITGTRTSIRAQVASVAYTTVISPSLVNNLKLGFNRLRAIDGVYGENSRDIVGELGIVGVNRDPANWGFPNLSTGFVSVVNDSANRPTNQRDNVYQIIEDFTASRGRHTITGGFEVRRHELNFRQVTPARSQIRFTGVYTAGPDPIRPTANTGLEFANFLLGSPVQATRVVGVPQAYLTSNYVGFHVGDTVRLTRRLTLIAGLRYDYFAPPKEKRGNYFNLDFSSLPAAPTLVRIGEGQTSLPSSGIQSNRTNFAPRVGLAFQYDPKTVIRSAYGIYYVQEIGAMYYTLVRNGVRTEVNDSPAAAPSLSLSNPFGNPRLSTPTYAYIDPESTTPYTQQWNFSIQRELPFRMVLETLYSGAKGTHLFRYRTFNTPFQTETGANLEPRPGNIQQLRTFPSLGPIQAAETSEMSIYHSLQVRLDKRLAAGVTFTNAFTWGKSIDDSDFPVQDGYQNAGAQDERNLRSERGLSFFDVRKRFTSGIVWDLPLGRGRRWMNEGLVGSLVGPWQVSSIVTMQDGYPQNFVLFGSEATLGTIQRASFVAGEKLVLSNEDRKNLVPTTEVPRPELQWYDPRAVMRPGPYELGNAGRNAGPTPGSVTVDLALFREFTLPFENHRLFFRADAVNALNIVNFGIPNSYVGFSFGQLLSAGPMRNVTLSMKYRF